MRKILQLILCLGLITQICLAQQTASPKIERVYLNEGDSTKNNYTIIYPGRQPYQGFIFLVPGFGENASMVLAQTNLPLQLAQSGLLTIIPSFQDGAISFGVDLQSQQTFNTLLKDVMAKHQVNNLPFYVGGFSIGGSCAIKYAENPYLKPAAVFGIDPPLDFERFYHAAKRDLRLSKTGTVNQENVYMIQRLERETGGNPASVLAAYRQLSPYSYSDTTQMAIGELVNMPLRIYTEPDIDW